MARIRTIKPEFFRHAEFYEAERESGLPLRLAFAGLWTAADREGRFKWKPRELKLDCLPHDELDFSRVLDALATRGWIVKYRVDGVDYGHIPTFKQHQIVNNRESPSIIPEPTESNEISTRAPRVSDACPTPLVQDQGEGKGRERKGNASDADASHPKLVSESPSDEKLFFDQANQILGPGGRSLAAKLLKAKGGVLSAHAALLTAAQKSDPREYLGAIIRGRERGPQDLRERGEAW